MGNETSVVTKWLKQYKVKHSKTFIERNLLSHPDYPSLYSITDTLATINVNAKCVVANKNDIHNLQAPFLIHYNTGAQMDFVLVEKIRPDGVLLYNGVSHQNVEVADFVMNWSGVLSYVDEYDPNMKSPAHKEDFKKDKLLQWLSIAALVAFVLVFSIAQMRNFNTFGFVYVSLSVIGAFVSLLILLKEIGVQSNLAAKICSTNKTATCENVLQSKMSNITQWLHVSDLSSIYFMASVAYSLVLTISGNIYLLNGTVTVISLLAFPITLLSLFYQKFVIKSWCRLCLLIVGVLWAQAALSIAYTRHIGSATTVVTGIFYYSIVALLLGSVLLVLKTLGKQFLQYKSEQPKLLALKRNPKIFYPYLLQQAQMKTNVPQSAALILGNPHAPVIITAACNPYCNPCAAAHKVLDEILDNHSDDVAIHIWFAVDAKELGDERTVAAEYLIACYQEAESAAKQQQLIHDWFTWMDINKFMQRYPLSQPERYEQLLSEHITWAVDNRISKTPTIFIDGHLFPPMFQVQDLALLMKHLIDYKKMDYPASNNSNNAFGAYKHIA